MLGDECGFQRAIVNVYYGLAYDFLGSRAIFFIGLTLLPEDVISTGTPAGMGWA